MSEEKEKLSWLGGLYSIVLLTILHTHGCVSRNTDKIKSLEKRVEILEKPLNTFITKNYNLKNLKKAQSELTNIQEEAIKKGYAIIDPETKEFKWKR